MPKRLVLCLVLVLLLLGALNAQEEKKARKVLKNADIVLMTQNHFDDETLTKIIEVSDTDFDVSTDALVDLMKQGVSSNVCRAMLTATRKKRTAASASNLQAATAPGSAPESGAPAQNITLPAGASPVPAPAAGALTGTAQPVASPGTPSSNEPDPNFAMRPSRTNASESSPPSPIGTSSNGAPSTASAANLAPPRPVANSAAMYPGGMSVSPQQMAMVQSQLAAMGMGGMMGGMGGMGMGGMGSFATNYSPEQMPHVFLKLGPNKGKDEITPSMAQIGQSKYNGGMGAGGMALRSLATEGLSFAAMGAGPGGMMAMSAFSMVSGFMPGMRPGTPKITYVWGLPGRTSSRTMSETGPIFELNYGDIPG
ncbi:MAG TPA: hypothetical protein VK466_12220, partial [Terriglobales bacterium]|nr:hypothetical protein [Terriglobales bacterium]